MTVKYVIVKYERTNEGIKHRPLFEFSSFEEADKALDKIHDVHYKYAVLPLVIE